MTNTSGPPISMSLNDVTMKVLRDTYKLLLKDYAADPDTGQAVEKSVRTLFNDICEVTTRLEMACDHCAHPTPGTSLIEEIYSLEKKTDLPREMMGAMQQRLMYNAGLHDAADVVHKHPTPDLSLVEKIQELPCYVARPGEGTYECRLDNLCPACELRQYYAGAAIPPINAGLNSGAPTPAPAPTSSAYLVGPTCTYCGEYIGPGCKKEVCKLHPNGWHELDVQRREIPVVDEKELYSVFYHGKYRDGLSEREAFGKAIRPHLRTTEPVVDTIYHDPACYERQWCKCPRTYKTPEPVSVSLEKCVDAANQERDKNGYWGENVVNAVLDAAGVKYA